jgi:hypothetical protein
VLSDPGLGTYKKLVIATAASSAPCSTAIPPTGSGISTSSARALRSGISAIDLAFGRALAERKAA